MQYPLIKELGLNKNMIVTVYGAGGKTSLINRMAQEISDQDWRVLVTTTTKIMLPPDLPTIIQDNLEAALANLQDSFSHNKMVVLGSEVLPGDKLDGIPEFWVDKIFELQLADVILVEGDGSAGKPIKGYADYEPCIPANSHLIMPVIGLEVLGATLDAETVHRPKKFSLITGASLGAKLTEHHLALCMKHMMELGRCSATGAQLIPVVNKVDLAANVEQLPSLAEKIISYGGAPEILFTSLQDQWPVKFIFHRQNGGVVNGMSLSCIVLAAGSSKRMGCDKLELDLHGKSVLEQTVEQIINSSSREIIIVARPGAPWIDRLSSDSRIRVVVNHYNHLGISSSIKTGLNAIGPGIQGAIFALGDQPLITTSVYQSLIEAHSNRLGLVVYPVYAEQRGNPLLFDRRTWPFLMKLQGDTGGRQILPRLSGHEKIATEVSCSGIHLDLDNPDDYARAKSYFHL